MNLNAIRIARERARRDRRARIARAAVIGGLLLALVAFAAAECLALAVF